jgi:small subunit ribosomal protein S1
MPAIRRELSLQQAPLDDLDGPASLDEEYWRVLLEQGQDAPETVPPTEPLEVFSDFGIESELISQQGWIEPRGGSTTEAADNWQLAQLALEQGELFHLRVSGANRGGLLVDWNGHQGFVPASHLKETPSALDPDHRASDLATRIGDTLTVRLIEVEPQQGQLVFSERAAMQGSHPSTAILNTLEPGDTCQGKVTNLTTFGAFVDLGGVEGLIHISELSWERVRHPSDVLAPGEEVKVHVLGINPDEERIALSLKRLRPDPWTQAESRYHPGQLIEGTITNVVNFGAFVRIEEGLEGLIHVSELAEGNFLHPRNVVREGDVVQVRVLNVDAANHRMGLSLRQAHNAGQASIG